MNSLEEAVLVKAVEIIVPSAARVDKGLFLAKADRMLDKFYPLNRLGAGIMLLMLEICPIVFIRRPKRFTKLNYDDALKYLKIVENSPFPFSYVLTVAKLLVMISYYGLPEGRKSAGFTLPPTPHFRETAE